MKCSVIGNKTRNIIIKNCSLSCDRRQHPCDLTSWFSDCFLHFCDFCFFLSIVSLIIYSVYGTVRQLLSWSSQLLSALSVYHYRIVWYCVLCAAGAWRDCSSMGRLVRLHSWTCAC